MGEQRLTKRRRETLAPEFGVVDMGGTPVREAGRAADDGSEGPALGPTRARLQWITICGPAAYMAFLAVAVLYLHPHPLPPVWPALALAVAVSALGSFVFSRFVFGHVDRQEQEIVRRTRELAEVKEALAVVKERQWIARELHDSVAQSLGYLHFRLADAERQVTAGGAAELEAKLADLKKVAREAYEEARQAIFGLRSMVSRSLGLIPMLTEYLHDWSRQTGIAVDLKVGSEEAITLPPVVEVQLIGIIQEAMANVRKHADARRVLASVARERGVARVAIRDDGKGFDPAALARGTNGCFGIETMRERAETVGGKLTLVSRPGHGTSVEVELPMDDPTRWQP